MRRHLLILLIAIPTLLAAVSSAKVSLDLPAAAKENTLSRISQIRTLNIRAKQLADSARYPEAVEIMQQALAIADSVIDPQGKSYAMMLMKTADYMFNSERYEDAIRYVSALLPIQEKLFGPNHPYCITTLQNIALCHDRLGNYAESKRYQTEALKRKNTTETDDIFDRINNLNDLAIELANTGDFVEAIRLGNQALELTAQEYGKDNAGYASILLNLSSYYGDIKDYPQGLAVASEALQRYQTAHGTNTHPDCAYALSKIAGFKYKMGQPDALNIADESIALFRQCADTLSMNYANALNDAGLISSHNGYYAKAIRYIEKSLQIKEKHLTKLHPNYALTLNNLSTLHYYQGDYEKAISTATEALALHEQTLGRLHPNYLQTLLNLAEYYYDTDNGQKNPKTKQYITDATEIATTLIIDAFKGLPAAQRAMYWDEYTYWFQERIPAFSQHYDDPDTHRLALDATLFSKGLLLNAETELSALIAENSDSLLLDKYRQMSQLTRQIETVSDKTVADSLRAIRSRLDYEIMAACKEYGDYTANLSIKSDDVRKALQPGDVAIEFIAFPYVGSTLYAAFVITPDSPDPIYCPLFYKYRLNPFLQKDTENSKYALSPQLAQLVWGPLRQHIKNAQRIYFSPAGELYNIPIEFILPREYTTAKIYRLSSTRLLAAKHTRPQGNKTSIYGGIQYQADAKTLRDDSRNYPAARSLSIDPRSLRIVQEIKELPGTLTEACTLDSILQTLHITPRLLTKKNATEASFKHMNGQHYNLIHIGTHGFYWTEDEATMLPQRLHFLSAHDPDREPAEDKALTRSGLLMAGAKNTITGIGAPPQDIDDGILTAKEISQLDLRDLDLVVLSACQTGLGDISGEGVFGLQRGFKKAGANTLLMSLWKVDDTATQILISRFYHNLFIRRLDKHEALEDAQRHLRDYILEKDETITVDLTPEEIDSINASDLNPVEKMRRIDAGRTITTHKRTRPYADPRYWAAFILLDPLP